ncbi:MAG: Holliday junction resolvase RuvX [Myxococcaceae bacterium]|nr:Holliday junction resolvase RuvX [Myxococcaceae bacterium]
MRAMGLDVGTKTVGVAVADELGLTAQPLTVVRRSNLKADLAELLKLATEREVDRFVIGLPLNMDGSEGPRAEATRRFGDALAKASNLSIIYQDERLTTVAAEHALLEANVSRGKRREVIDQVAASIILQGWLDAQPRSPPA